MYYDRTGRIRDVSPTGENPVSFAPSSLCRVVVVGSAVGTASGDVDIFG